MSCEPVVIEHCQLSQIQSEYEKYLSEIESEYIYNEEDFTFSKFNKDRNLKGLFLCSGGKSTKKIQIKCKSTGKGFKTWSFRGDPTFLSNNC